MNIYPLIRAVEQLDIAASLTPDKDERNAITVASSVMRKLLQKRGVFIGATQANMRQVESGREVPWCKACKSWHDRPKDKAHKAALQCKAK